MTTNGYLPSPGQHPAYQISRDVLTFLTVVFSFYAANAGSRNHERMERVEETQSEVVRRQTEAVRRAEEVKTTLDRRARDDDRALGVQLYGTWKYLEDVATNSGSSADRTKATEARRLYEEHIKRQHAAGDPP